MDCIWGKLSSMFRVCIFLLCVVISCSIKAKEKELRVAVLNQYPFVIVKDGKVTSGLLVEKMRLLVEKAGYKATFYSMPSAGRLLDLLERGRMDAALSLFYSEERAKRYEFVESPLYMHSVLVLLSNKTYPQGIKSLNDLQKGRIGYIRGFYLGKKVDPFMRKIGAEYKMDINKPQKALKLMLKGRVTSTISDFEIPNLSNGAVYTCKGLEYRVEHLDSVPSYIAMHKSSRHANIARQLNNALIEIENSGLGLAVKQKFWHQQPKNGCIAFNGS
ncbi:transporter substrate-binding domain-containing protein [Temperatibacter marinus]|uniref:Transporter substrate-binding domain-containing protein n=1 Tax=Temperatibacter marinus TaxID=1456591 RepID=A0AA52EB95_9PROT|nr:transporter substrate-binding domain-containing protein [Temperatibacter marinus]WND01651.1 transporter substrate-binding domain-containing protein [Temperatibacter marinus]